MSVFTDVRPDGAILYAFALENHRTGFAGMIYAHGRNVVEASKNLPRLARDTRIVAVAPAVGVLAELDERDNVKELIV